jgi:hypothetical protein
MAWHTVQETLKLTGKSRSQLYRDMAKGLVSYRTGKNDRREFETSELIRAYGELRTSETPKRHKEGHSKSVVSQAENAQLDVIQQKLDALQQTVTLMLEDKMAREAENRLRNEEREQLQAEISRLADALAQEKSGDSGRGCFARFRVTVQVTLIYHNIRCSNHNGRL